MIRWWMNARLATFEPSIRAPYGALEGYAIAVRDGEIHAIIPSSEAGDGEIIDCQGRWITPGLIDCHTHLIYGGNRAAEWEMRLAGVPYTEIAKRGGGILSSVRATRELSEHQLFETSLPRLHALMDEGVTTVEIKSGYGLTLEDELKMLRVAKRLEESESVHISRTLLAAHAVPPEFKDRADDYVNLIISEMIPAAAEQDLAHAVDAFCESIAFSVVQCQRVWTAAREYGLGIKGHVEQLTNQHGAVALARLGAWSADHIEYLDDYGIETMAGAGTVAVLLPGAYYFLRENQKPPIEKLRAAGVPMAVATDLNPGTSPFASLRLAMNMACVLFGLSPEEALTGATRNAARALGRADQIGTLEVGKRADFVVWDVEHPAEIVGSIGVNAVYQRVFGGNN
ncbi:MAG: imidazolonepropionase [Gemmataceae bacterium]